MNLAIPTSTPTAVPDAAASATSPTSTAASARAPADTAVATASAPADAAPFDQILSRQIDAGRNGVPDAVTALGTDPRAATTGLRKPLDPTAAGTADAAEPPVARAVVAAGAAGAKGDPTAALQKTADDGKDDQTAAPDLAHDLASQLALVAQWAGIGKPAVADAATTPSGATVDPQLDPKGADIQGKLVTVRGATDREQLGAAPLVADSASTDATTAGTATASTAAAAHADDRTTTFAELAASLDSAAATTPGATTVTLDAANLATTLATTVTHAAISQANAAPAASAASSAVPDRLHEQVGSPAWAHEVGQAALRIAGSELQTASLRLNPEHLGPLDVQVRIDDGVAHVAFQAAHADTRQALDGSRTTLDQMFQSQGLKTGEVSIGSSTRDTSDTTRFGAAGGGSNASGDNGSGRRGGSEASGADDGSAITTRVRLVRALGLVDTFA